MIRYQVTAKNNSGDQQIFEIEEREHIIVLVKYLSYDIANVLIPATINGKPVTEIGWNCFFAHEEITTIIFPETLTTIDQQAFALCKGIQELVLPDSITEIGYHAFRDCIGLKKIMLPSGLRVLKVGVFAFCYMNDAHITVPYGLEVIESHAFFSAGTFNLALPDSVIEIQHSAFRFSNPKLITSLPYDKGWFMSWPYGQKIVDSEGNTGIISGCREVGYGCMILSVEMGDMQKRIFYPLVTKDGITFADESNQKMMERDLYKNQEAIKIHEAWLKGLI